MGKEKEIGINRIYVVHAPVGYEQQEKRLQSILKDKYGFDYEFLERDPDELIPEYFIANIREELSQGTIMCTLNHIMFYKRMVQNNDKYALILEDDPFFNKNFPQKLKQVVSEASRLPIGFFISLENSTLKFPSRKIIRKNKSIYEADRGRCAGAYLLDLKAAENIINWLKYQKCDKTIDHWHNDLIAANVFKMYWAHPPFVEQGSLNGKMNFAKSTKDKGIKRRISWLFQKCYKSYVLHFLK